KSGAKRARSAVAPLAQQHQYFLSRSLVVVVVSVVVPIEPDAPVPVSRWVVVAALPAGPAVPAGPVVPAAPDGVDVVLDDDGVVEVRSRVLNVSQAPRASVMASTVADSISFFMAVPMYVYGKVFSTRFEARTRPNAIAMGRTAHRFLNRLCRKRVPYGFCVRRSR